MNLLRMIVVLAGVLAVMLAIVILRAETIRLNYEGSRAESQADALVQELRKQKLELARLRNPDWIRKRVAEMRLNAPAAPAPAKSAAQGRSRSP